MTRPVGWFEIYVEDIERVRVFYERTLGIHLKVLDSPDPAIQMLAFPGGMDEGIGCSGALVQMPDGPYEGVLVYFMCEDCAIEAGRVVENGGQVVRDKFAIGQYGFAAIVKDSEGTVIGLHSMR